MERMHHSKIIGMIQKDTIVSNHLIDVSIIKLRCESG